VSGTKDDNDGRGEISEGLMLSGIRMDELITLNEYKWLK
jgi:hypothetical protein